MSDQAKAPRVKVTSLWSNEMKNGGTYLSGSNGSVRYSIWPNGYKEKESDPTHVLYIEGVTKKAE